MSSMHRSYITVRGYELDSYGHVNNAVYLQYYEHARWEMMRDLGFLEPLKEEGVSVVVVESQIRYMREIIMFDELVIESSLKVESPYLIFNQKIISKKNNMAVSRAKIKTIFLGKDRVPQDVPSFLTFST